MNVIKNFGKEVVEKVIKNRPVITTVAALGSLALTAVIIYRETPKIKKVKEEHDIKIDEIENNPELSEDEKKAKKHDAMIESAKDIVIPVGKIAGGIILTGALIISINKAHSLKTEALIAAYEVSKGKVKGYEDILPEVVGPKKAEEIKTKVMGDVANEQAERHGYSSNVCIMDDSRCVCRDVFGNQWIGTYNDIENAKNQLNTMLVEGTDCTLNDMYDFLPDCNRTAIGDDMIFEAENGTVDIRYSTIMDEVNHKPMIVIDYHVSPKCHNPRFCASASELAQKTVGLSRW